MNAYQSMFDTQKEHLFTDITKTYEWRMTQLDNVEKMLLDNENELCEALYQDFGKPEFEQRFEILENYFKIMPLE